MRLNINPDYSRNNCTNYLCYPDHAECPFMRFSEEDRLAICPYVINDENFIDIRELLNVPKCVEIEPYLLRPLQQSQLN